MIPAATVRRVWPASVSPRSLFSKLNLLALLLVLGGLAGCSVTYKEPPNYDLFHERMPRSILVLPPTNASVDINASYTYLTTVTRPLAEKGYYVFPVAVVDVLMKENGLPFPDDMHKVPLDKLTEVIAADAVMYINITEFGQKYEIFDSVTRVEADIRLVDTATGAELWADSVSASEDSASGDNGLLGDMLEAVIAQVATDVSKATRSVSAEANQKLAAKILMGPLHPDFVAATDEGGGDVDEEVECGGLQGVLGQC